MAPSTSEAGFPVLRVFGELLFHTDGELLDLAFDAAGTLWSLEEAGVLRQWEPATGRQLQRFFLSDLENLWGFSPQAEQAVSASDDLAVWTVATGQCWRKLPQPSWVTAVAFGATANVIVTGHDDNVVRVWDVAAERLVQEFRGHRLPPSALAVNPEGSVLASAAEDRRIILWDLASGKQLLTLEGHTDRIPALTWHPQGKILVSAGWDTTARVWDTVSGDPVILLNTHADQVTALAFSPDGRYLVSADSAFALHVWDAATWKTLRVLTGHEDEIRCLAFGRSKWVGRWVGTERLVPQLVSGGADRVIRRWDLDRGQRFSNSQAAQRHAIGLPAQPEIARLASNCGGMALRIWDTATGEAILNREADQGLHSVAYSPDGRWIAESSSTGPTRLLDASGNVRLNLEGQPPPVTVLAFSADSSRLASASASNGTIWLWDIASGIPILVIPEASDGCSVESIAFHPKAPWLACGGIDWLATGGSDGAVCIWDIDRRCRIALFDRGTTSLAFHPSGRWLAATSLAVTVNIWDVETQQLVAELGGHEEGVTCLAYSPDGRWLASGSDDRVVRLWDAQTFDFLAERELDTPIKSLAFSPDSRHLFTGNGNTTCYQLEVERLLA